MTERVESLKVIALISGGKDSFYSILHCIENGHEVVALANLFPALKSSLSEGNTLERKDESHGEDSETEDLDSYMYQTVGHNIIPLYSEALGLPLYRQEIKGAAVDTAANYRNVTREPLGQYSSTLSALPTERTANVDETESLVPLLTRVKAAHPEANALSTGAILSTYQRTRVESVALRLGLVPLSFLWQYPSLPPYRQSSLLEDMVAVGMDARIVKVASGGLDERTLWLNVADSQPIERLERDMARFGGDVCGLESGSVLGEGGEFETLAIDGPGPLWKKRIEVDKADREIIMGEGGSCLVRISKARVVEKSAGLAHVRPRVPNLFDVEFSKLLHTFATTDFALASQLTRSSSDVTHFSGLSGLRRDIITTRNTVHITNLTSLSHTDTFDQIQHIISDLQTILSTHNLTPTSIAFTTILLRNMADFTAVNQVYGSLFAAPLPPARATVTCGDSLPQGINVALSAIAHTGDTIVTRTGLHVQSRSYWAPANIGPYSQAISVSMPLPSPAASSQEQYAEAASAEDATESARIRYTHIAGQIPLLPISNTLLASSDSFLRHAALALQHVWRIARATRAQWLASCVAFIAPALSTSEADWSVTEAAERAAIVTKMWQEAQSFGSARSNDEEGEGNNEDEDGEDIDIAELALRGRSWQAYSHSHSYNYDKHSGSGTANSEPQRRPLPDPSVVPTDAGNLAVVEVAALPRGAEVEWLCGGMAFEVSGRAADRGRLAAVRTSGMLRAVVEAGELEAVVAEVRGSGGVFLGVCEIYATDKIPGHELEEIQAAVIPCRGVWVGGQEVLGVVRMF